MDQEIDFRGKDQKDKEDSLKAEKQIDNVFLWGPGTVPSAVWPTIPQPRPGAPRAQHVQWLLLPSSIAAKSSAHHADVLRPERLRHLLPKPLSLVQWLRHQHLAIPGYNGRPWQHQQPFHPATLWHAEVLPGSHWCWRSRRGAKLVFSALTRRPDEAGQASILLFSSHRHGNSRSPW